MQDGLFWSSREGDFMVPDFGYTVHERLGPVVEEREAGPQVEVHTVESTKARKLKADWLVEVEETLVFSPPAKADSLVIPYEPEGDEPEDD